MIGGSDGHSFVVIRVQCLLLLTPSHYIDRVVNVVRTSVVSSGPWGY